jgi:hypothetical protein
MSDFFLLEQRCAFTFSARGYKAFDKANRGSVGLWVSREPLADASSAAFAQRMEALRTRAGVSEIRSFGVDARGVAFVALSNFDGFKIAAEPADMRERERRFLMCVKAVERVHAAGLVCGELCAESFYLSRSGAVRLIGIMGELPLIEEPPRDELVHLHPYSRTGVRCGESIVADDVYALLVLGYHLLSGEYPDRSAGDVAPLRLSHKDVPAWLDDFLVPLLNADPSQLPHSAGAFLEQLKLYKEGELCAELAPAPVEPQPKTAAAHEGDAVQVRLANPVGEARVSQRAVFKPDAESNQSQRRVAIIIAFAFFAAFFMEGRAFVSWIDGLINGPEIAEIHPGDVAVAITNSGTLEERREQLKVIFASEDPVAHDTLLRRLRQLKDTPEREFVVSGLLERSQRMGLLLSSAEARRWIQDLALLQSPSVLHGSSGHYQSGITAEQILKVTDPLLPQPLRIDLLTACYERDPTHTAVMAAALALDMGQMEAFAPFVSRYAKGSLEVADADRRSLLSLLFLLPEFAQSHADLLRDRVGQIPDEDLTWLLKEVVVRKVSGVQQISSQLISRQIISGLQVLFLKELGAATSLPLAVEVALVSSAIAGPSKEDLVTFSKWYSPAAANILFVVVLTAKDESLAALAFDAILAKPVASPVLANLLEVIRSAPRVDRMQAGRVSAAMAVEPRLSDQELSAVLRGLQVDGALQPVIDTLFRSSSSRVINELLQQYGDQLGSGLIHRVLQHPDPKVRLRAVELLALTKNRAAQQEALELYLREEDADVIAAYKRVLQFEEGLPGR